MSPPPHSSNIQKPHPIRVKSILVCQFLRDYFKGLLSEAQQKAEMTIVGLKKENDQLLSKISTRDKKIEDFHGDIEKLVKLNSLLQERLEHNERSNKTSNQQIHPQSQPEFRSRVATEIFECFCKALFRRVVINKALLRVLADFFGEKSKKALLS